MLNCSVRLTFLPDLTALVTPQEFSTTQYEYTLTPQPPPHFVQVQAFAQFCNVIHSKENSFHSIKPS